MPEYDRTHPQWVIPPVGGSPDPTTIPPAALPGAWTPAASPPPAHAGAPTDRAGSRRPRRATGRRRPRRGVVAAAVALALLVGGGAGGFALAAGDAPDRGVVLIADDGNGRPDRGGPDGARGALDG